MRFQRFIHMVLLLGVCGLGWQVFVAWSGVRPPVAAEAPADLNTAIPSLPRAELRTGRRLAGVITAKNLFAPDRRPARKILPPNPDEQKIVVPPPDHLKLVGVFMADGRLEALFADASKGGKVTRVRSGDSFDAYQLTRLTHSDATLALGAGGEEVSLSLNIQKSSEAVKAPRTKQPRRQAAAKAQDAEGKAETAASPLVLGSDAVQTAATQAAEKTDAKTAAKTKPPPFGRISASSSGGCGKSAAVAPASAGRPGMRSGQPALSADPSVSPSASQTANLRSGTVSPARVCTTREDRWKNAAGLFARSG